MPDLIDKLGLGEQRDSAVIAMLAKHPNAEQLAMGVLSSVFQTFREFNGQLSEDVMLGLAAKTIAPILQAWKDQP